MIDRILFQLWEALWGTVVMFGLLGACLLFVLWRDNRKWKRSRRLPMS